MLPLSLLILWMSFGFLLLGHGQAAAKDNPCPCESALAAAEPSLCKNRPALACCKSGRKHDKDKTDDKHKGKPPYLTAEEVEPLSVLPPPPAPCATQDTCATGVELTELRRLRDGSSREEEEKACRDHEQTAGRFLEASTADEELREAVLSCELASGLFERIRATEDEVTKAAKNAKDFQRCRPYKVDSTLSPVKSVDPESDSCSYPSGHATYGTLIGLVLADLWPSDLRWRSAMYRRMEDFGYSRLVSRVHYRSDVYAGHLTGEHIYKKLDDKKEFRDDFKKTKTCVEAALRH
jgi:acid phosphatase (class A)